MIATPSLRADRVSVDTGGRTILDDVTFEVVPGALLALVGPNGAGKSTLLGVLAGELAPSRGTVRLGERRLRELRHLERSRARAVLTQENAVSFPFSVRDVVEMGRAPWARLASLAEDEAAIDAAIDATDIRHLLTRTYPSLSGGERARVSLARVLVQDTPIVLLDEPTAALDLGHQEDVMRVARRLARAGRAVVVVLHDLSLAAAYADRIALLADGRLAAIGAPDAVLTPELIARVYRVDVDIVRHEGAPLVVPRRA
ncbi:MAG: heme ABC transporter ATP-binding protein [Microbacteriaceae bacterium]|nr:heme ABC transporter ATP-binding protein [Microbacteriaceae bacterium]